MILFFNDSISCLFYFSQKISGIGAGKQCHWNFSPFLCRTCTSEFIYNITDAEQIQRKDLRGFQNYLQKMESITWPVSVGWVFAFKPTKSSRDPVASLGMACEVVYSGPYRGTQCELRKSFNQRLSDMIYGAAFPWASLTGHSESALPTLADFPTTQQRSRLIGTSWKWCLLFSF